MYLQPVVSKKGLVASAESQVHNPLVPSHWLWLMPEHNVVEPPAPTWSDFESSSRGFLLLLPNMLIDKHNLQ